MYNGRYYWPLTLSKEDSSYAHQRSSEVLEKEKVLVKQKNKAAIQYVMFVRIN